METSKPPSKYVQAIATCKHFDAYSLENYDNVTRHQFNAIVDQRDLEDTYLPMFEFCARASSGVMCSYNALNGVPSCANTFLLRHLLRNKWKFNGYIVSDCNAISDVMNEHHYTSTTGQTCRTVLEAGVNVNCGHFFSNYLLKAVLNGSVSEKLIDSALYNALRVLFRAGFFDSLMLQPFSNATNYGPAHVNSKEHQKLAQVAAEKSIVLAKNGGDGALPWPVAAVRRLLIVGPHGNASETLLGDYYGRPRTIVTILEGFQTIYGTKVDFVQGVKVNATVDGGLAAAVAAARSASHVLLAFGIDQTIEHEGLDRYSIRLPSIQEKFLLDFLSSVTAMEKKKSMSMVLLCGGVIDVEPFASSIPSLLYAGYPGERGGAAIARIVAGEVNPSGRLSFSWYREQFTQCAPFFNMSMRSDLANGYCGRTYRFYEGNEPLNFEFGHGLSYSRWTYEWEEARGGLVAAAVRRRLRRMTSAVDERLGAAGRRPLLVVTVNVTNHGPRDGSQSVLLFVEPAKAGQDGEPLRFLADFRRVDDVRAGTWRLLSFPITADVFQHVYIEGQHKIYANQQYIGDLLVEE